MKILKHGNLPDHEFTCNRCGCVFIADYSEYTEIEVTNLYSDKRYIEAVETDCPDCGRHVKKFLHEDVDVDIKNLPDTPIPTRVWNSLLSKGKSK